MYSGSFPVYALTSYYILALGIIAEIKQLLIQVLYQLPSHYHLKMVGSLVEISI